MIACIVISSIRPAMVVSFIMLVNRAVEFQFIGKRSSKAQPLPAGITQ